MPEMLFCYHCRVYHPKDQMRLFPTRRGDRWRCVRSIQAARQGVSERESFGRSQTEANRHRSQRQGLFAHQVRCAQQEQGM